MWHSCKVNRIDLIYSTFLTVPVDSNAKAFGSVLEPNISWHILVIVSILFMYERNINLNNFCSTTL